MQNICIELHNMPGYCRAGAQTSYKLKTAKPPIAQMNTYREYRQHTASTQTVANPEV